MRVLLPVVPLTDNYLGIFYTRNVSHRTLYGGQFPFINSVDKWKIMNGRARYGIYLRVFNPISHPLG